MYSWVGEGQRKRERIPKQTPTEWGARVGAWSQDPVIMTGAITRSRPLDWSQVLLESLSIFSPQNITFWRWTNPFENVHSPEMRGCFELEFTSVKFLFFHHFVGYVFDSDFHNECTQIPRLRAVSLQPLRAGKDPEAGSFPVHQRESPRSLSGCSCTCECGSRGRPGPHRRQGSLVVGGRAQRPVTSRGASLGQDVWVIQKSTRPRPSSRACNRVRGQQERSSENLVKRT